MQPLATIEFLYNGNRYTITVYPTITHLTSGNGLMRYKDVLAWRDGLWDFDAILWMIKDFTGE